MYKNSEGPRSLTTDAHDYKSIFHCFSAYSIRKFDTGLNFETRSYKIMFLLYNNCFNNTVRVTFWLCRRSWRCRRCSLTKTCWAKLVRLGQIPLHLSEIRRNLSKIETKYGQKWLDLAILIRFGQNQNLASPKHSISYG